MRPGGWYASGDLGYVADDGALFVVGRLKEMIIRSGFNVYPGEVEALQAYIAEHLAPYKRPSRIVLVDDFPMTLSGKVLKRQMLADWSEAGR